MLSGILTDSDRHVLRCVRVHAVLALHEASESMQGPACDKLDHPAPPHFEATKLIKEHRRRNSRLMPNPKNGHCFHPVRLRHDCAVGFQELALQLTGLVSGTFQEQWPF